uniref:Uncharacterized protein n=1 Tax=Rhipicephalus zambeziensis TaxID=60191 RepID=A0A224YGH2_9ACAR
MNAIATNWNVKRRMASRSKRAARCSRTHDARKQHAQDESELKISTARHLTRCSNKNDARNVFTGTGERELTSVTVVTSLCLKCVLFSQTGGLQRAMRPSRAR